MSPGPSMHVQYREPPFERLFSRILPLTVALFAGIGIVFTLLPPPEKKDAVDSHKAAAIRARFTLREKKEEPPPPPKPKKKKEKAIDLTDKPKMGKKHEDHPEPKPQEKKVRRVYGVRKVYAKGIGSGGSLSDAVIGKLGNTINKEVDTITATQEEIKGDVVSTTTVTRAPRYKKQVKPEYTEEMITERIEGVVKVKVLIDIDGKVKKAEALNDIGSGAAGEAVKAAREMEFHPALRGRDPVAVWIVIPIRFVLLG